MSWRWWIGAEVGLLEDGSRAAMPWPALHAGPGGQGAEAWLELPTTRWGWRHRDLSARANFDYLEAVSSFVQRVRAVDEDWRALIVREEDAWRLDDVWAALEAGRRTWAT